MANQPGNPPKGERFGSGTPAVWRGAGSQSAEDALRCRAELLEQMHDAVLVWELYGRIVYWNRGAERVYGYTAAQAMGRTSHELLRTHHPLSARHFQDVLARTGHWIGQLYQRTADGRQVVVESRMVLLPSTDVAQYVLETARDITQRKQADEQIQAANHALEQRVADLTAQVRTLATQLSQAEQRERQRLAHALHDQLLQLLGAARFSASILQGHPYADCLYQFLVQVDDLLDQPLDSPRSLAGQFSPPILHHGSMSQILHWLARWMREKHGMSVQVNADEQANPRSEEVRIFLFHAVRELLFSVLRHAGTHKATITLVPSPEFVQIGVADEGVGFDIEAVRGSGRAGASLGFESIRVQLEKWGGRMEVHSAAGVGTLVVLLAPMNPGVAVQQAAATPAAAEAETEGPAEEPPPAGDVPKIRVLLADDHAVVRDGLRRLLQMQPDMEVVAQAADGLEAVDLALQLRPDVIVLDANMPRLNGIQAARRILAKLPDVKIIGLSMYTAADMDLAMRQAGVCQYLTKTSSPETVITAVRACVASE